MANIDQELHISGETAIKYTTSKTTTITENPASTENATTLEKEDTGLLIVGLRKGKINIMTLTTSLWEPHSVENFKNTTTKKIMNNVWETAVCYCTLHTTRKT